MIRENFETTIEDKTVSLLQIKNKTSLRAGICTYGARLVELVFNEVNVVVGFPTLKDYFMPPKFYHGATIGRYANRIQNGSFTLHKTTYSLPVNNGPNHLHGGPLGFHQQVWKVVEQHESSATLYYRSPDGEAGYPGSVDVYVTFLITEDNALDITYKATTDADTPFNITNHAYFNLNGEGTALHHQLQINAEAYTPVSPHLIPTGIQPVANTAFDFRTLKSIGKDIDNEEEQIHIGGGYDHNFVLNKETPHTLSFAAKAIGDQTGIAMEIYTTEPGLQLFSANIPEVVLPNSYRTSFCLETQHFPDSPNQPKFPDVIIKPGQTFHSRTIYKFTQS